MINAKDLLELAKKATRARTKGELLYYQCMWWSNINYRSVNGSRKVKHTHYVKRGIRLCFNKEDFYRWVESQFPHIRRMFLAGETPSLDRIDTDGHYELKNVRVLSLSENILKGQTTGWQRTSRKVHVIYPDGTKKNFSSVKAAARATGVNDSLICKHINGHCSYSKMGFAFKALEKGRLQNV